MDGRDVRYALDEPTVITSDAEEASQLCGVSGARQLYNGLHVFEST